MHGTIPPVLKTTVHIRPFVIWAAYLFISATPAAVQADGVAVLKEQTYHRDSSAKPVAYQRIISSNGPYLRFVTSSGNLDILRKKLADRIEIPKSIPHSIQSETDAAPVRDMLSSINSFSTRYPLSTDLLAPCMASISAHLARFDSGEIRFEGGWFTKEELATHLAQRQREADAQRRQEVEKVISNEARIDDGWVWKNGTLVSPQDADQQTTTGRTALSDTLWPLLNPDLDSARMTLENLASLAAKQNGPPKVRTERLRSVIRNMFSAEFQLSRQLITNSTVAEQAADHDRRASEYLKPNSFGRVREEASRDSHAKAFKIRNEAATNTEDLRNALLLQFREADTVTQDFQQLGELRVALTLAEATRKIAARSLPNGEYKPTLSDETLAAMRNRIYPEK